MKTENGNKQKARQLHAHSMRMRTFILRGEMSDKAWTGMKREPTLPQIKALLALNTFGPCTLKTAAHHLGISGASASQMMDRLVENGLVERRRDPEDRRRVILELTDEARRRTSQHEKSVIRQIEKLIELIGPQATDKWLEVAQRISEVLQEEDTRKSPS